jgi:hypothetical protein
MNDMPTTAGLKAELAAILGRVRRRWRWRRALLGTVWFLGVCAFVVLIAAFTVDAWHFAPEIVGGARIASYLLCACALLYFIAIPVFQRVTDRRLALYVEEREPSLGMALASAADLEDNTGNANSAALERGLIEQSLVACHEVDDGRRVDAPKLRRNALLVALSIAATVLMVEQAPANLRQAFQLIFFPRMSAASVSPYHLTVEPGDILVSRGADQLIVARTEGFEPQEITLLTRFGNAAEWQRAAMIPGGDSHSFEMFLFDLARSGEYRVLAEGLRSRIYRIEVAELPEVERIDLTYHYPARLALPARTVVDGGDISAVRGSRVVVTVVPSQGVSDASLVLNGRESLPMAQNEDGNWTAALAIDEEGQYRIDLPYGDNTQVAASPNYAIEVVADRAPTVKISRFGRDSQVTNVEEALIEVSGRDDLNIATLELVYAINDQPEKTVVLYQGNEAKTGVTAGHTLRLEDYALSPGDLIAYYARAADSTAENARTSTTDIFFMQVRPFDRSFRRSQGGGGGSQGGNQERSLSAQQRQLVIATFKLARDRDSYDEARFTDTMDTLETAQARIRDRVQAIIRRIGTRNVMQRNAGIQRMREELPQAVTAMKEAEQRLGANSPVEALPPARKALQHLQRAEAAFRDAEIAFGRSTGSGARDAEDLANLFRLEMDKLRSKYESVQRGNWQQSSRELDEALKKLEELARRQQKEVERLERRVRLDPNAPSGGGSQRALAEELEEMVRRLQRLSREQQSRELENLARQARAAAESMRRATGNDSDSNDNGVADARAALERLRNIQRRANNQPQQQLQRGIDSASRRARRLAEEHADIGTGIEALPEEQRAPREGTSKLQSRKLRMAGEVRDLESVLRALAKDAKKENAATSRALRRTADRIDKDDLADTIEISAAAIDGISKESSRRMEAEIGASLQRIGKGLGEAAESVDRPEKQKRARSLAQMRALVEGLESLERQMLQRSRGDQASAGEPRGGWGTADGQSRIDRDFDPADITEFRRDLAERRGLLERLAEVMTSDEHGARDISRLLKEMRELERSGIFADTQRALQRQRQLIAQLKELELRLGSDPDKTETRALPDTGNDAVPPEYRPQVEEYFRELSRGNDATNLTGN